MFHTPLSNFTAIGFITVIYAMLFSSTRLLAISLSRCQTLTGISIQMNSVMRCANWHAGATSKTVGKIAVVIRGVKISLEIRLLPEGQTDACRVYMVEIPKSWVRENFEQPGYWRLRNGFQLFSLERIAVACWRQKTFHLLRHKWEYQRNTLCDFQEANH